MDTNKKAEIREKLTHYIGELDALERELDELARSIGGYFPHRGVSYAVNHMYESADLLRRARGWYGVEYKRKVREEE